MHKLFSDLLTLLSIPPSPSGKFFRPSKGLGDHLEGIACLCATSFYHMPKWVRCSAVIVLLLSLLTKFLSRWESLRWERYLIQLFLWLIERRGTLRRYVQLRIHLSRVWTPINQNDTSRHLTASRYSPPPHTTRGWHCCLFSYLLFHCNNKHKY